VIRSKPYYWITCDHPGCEERSPGSGYEYSAWSEPQDVITCAEEGDWQQQGDLWFCPDHAVEEESGAEE